MMLSSCVANKPFKETKSENSVSNKSSWWQQFNDPVMNKLADKIVSQNIDLKIAQTRVDQAHASATIEKSILFPNIAFSGNTSHQDNLINTKKAVSIAKGGFEAAWEIDLFGSNRASSSAARKRIESTMANQDDVKNSIIAELFKGLVELYQAKLTICTLEKIIALQNSKIDLLDKRYNAGLIDATSFEDAKMDQFQTNSQLSSARGELLSAQYIIEKLMGGKDEGEIYNKITEQQSILSLPKINNLVGISISTIKKRPDVRYAQQEMLASRFDLAKAEADLWPTISVSNFFGVQHFSKGIIAAANPVWSMAADISTTIFDFGLLRAKITLADIKLQQAVLNYENSVLSALQEAKTALSTYLSWVNYNNELERSLDNQKELTNIASEQFNSGVADMIIFIDQKIHLEQLNLQIITSKANTIISYIKLQKALAANLNN
jgi:NodT family efflux transporter outer membrane factor (OMF) lipoprotein